MPRLARLDAPGVLHHVIIRGIEHRRIFRDSNDQDDLLVRFEALIPKTNISYYAWAPLSDHAHFLLRRLFCYWTVRDLGYSMLEIAGRLGISLDPVGNNLGLGVGNNLGPDTLKGGYTMGLDIS
jgi:hypothetical protein